MQDRSSASSGPLERTAALKGAGWLGRSLSPLFRRIRVDGEAADRLRDAYANGLVVHVFRASRMTDPLFLLFTLQRLGLPRPQWMHDHHASKTRPSAADLRTSLEAGHGAVLFLRRPRTLLSPSGRYEERHVEVLLEAQRHLDRPILLLPETLQWTKRPVGLRPTIIDSIFGNREAPGALREIVGFLWNYQDARFHIGAPIDLRATMAREEGNSDQVVARKIRWVIGHHLSREEQLRTGPMVRSMARTRQMVLKDPSVRRFLTLQAEKGKNPKDLERKAEALVRGIAADMRFGWLRVLDALIDVVWSRIYDGIVVDQEGLNKLRRAARRGPVVLVPSHKSHIDYIVLSQVFFKDGLMPPLVAAGENLNFWPMGFIFRRSGAFFIRRSFGDKLYSVVFAAYVRRLLKEGHAIEFFIEGGRSRTGKLLPPRTGMLSMCADPVLEGRIADVAFIPVSISYEKIIEAGAYAKELAGGEKRKEDARGLLSSAKLLRSRYGRVYVDFAEAVSLTAFAESKDVALQEDRPLEPGGRRELVTQLGHRIVNGINAVTRATPTSIAALVLLARPQRGLSEAALYPRADWVIAALESIGARVSSTLGPTTRKAALNEALERFIAEGKLKRVTAPDGETVFQLDDAGRQALDYYKNNILHFLVPAAVVALAHLLQDDLPADEHAVSAAALRISRLLKNEFSFRVDRGFDENFQHALALLERHGVLRSDDEGRRVWTDAGRAMARELAGLIAPFFEAYRITAEALDDVEERSLPVRKFVVVALSLARRRVIEGQVRRAEAAVQPTIKHALSVLKENGVVTSSGGIQLADREGRDSFVAEISRYLSAVSA